VTAGQPLTVKIGDTILTGTFRQSKNSGSWGWQLAGKTNVEGKAVQVTGNVTIIKSAGPVAPVGEHQAQVGVNIVIIGSKPGSTAGQKKTKKPAPAPISAQDIAPAPAPVGPIAQDEVEHQFPLSPPF
jgi:hypothetical protein